LRRRDLIAGIGASLTLPGTGAAQRRDLPVVGFINSASPGPFAHLAAGFRKGLAEEGFVDGRNMEIEWRWAERY
jgi:putative ABC transport system substrate-binding protein